MTTCQHVYLAAVYHNGRTYSEVTLHHPYMLESYHYASKSKPMMTLLREHERKIFLDSGAFSAYTLGATIDIKSYARFIKDNQDVIDVASVLDGIGDAQLTLDNQHRLEDMGCQVLPCYHYGEDPKYLEHYLENYDHITIGGMVPISNRELRKWLDMLWAKYLTDEHGLPRVKVHGFGMTSMPLVQRYPWFSVDSSSWVQTGVFGGVLYIRPDRRVLAIKISAGSPDRHNINQHYDTMPPIEQQQVRQFVEARDYNMDELREHSTPRKAFNARVFTELGERELFAYRAPTGDLFDA